MKIIFYSFILVVLFTSCDQKQAETSGYTEYNTDTAASTSELEEKNQISHRAQALEKLVEAFPVWQEQAKQS